MPRRIPKAFRPSAVLEASRPPGLHGGRRPVTGLSDGEIPDDVDEWLPRSQRQLAKYLRRHALKAGFRNKVDDGPDAPGN